MSIERVEEGVYLARNARGGELRFGSRSGDGFTPVELLLAAIAGCTAVDIDVVAGRRATPESFTGIADAEYVRDETGNALRDIQVTYTVRFPEGEAGDAARAIVPRVLKTAHERTCTVSRTIEAGTPITFTLD
ncbi:MAG: Conserved OsmC-like protein [Actinotalea sp.]|nr:Conserved OsmC-like protein [Actinotalea sp.]